VKRGDLLRRVIIAFIAIMLTACAGLTDRHSGVESGPVNSAGPDDIIIKERSFVNPEGRTIEDRILVPEGFERTSVEPGSFAEYLRNLPLKPHGSRVLYYDGRVKERDVHQAVVDMDIGDRDLQQCADAVIRLRAEYLYGTGQYEKIHFNFTNGFNARYIKWMQGSRISVNGNNVSWVDGAGYSDDYESFREYLDMVFAYAGTLSLSKELKRLDACDIGIGDVFIRGGSPGHCAIVVDMARCVETGKKIFLLAQSYMPAQDIHILKNTMDAGIGPWFRADFGDELVTPEWTFKGDQLMRFAE
jgi:hypothetical protein